MVLPTKPGFYFDAGGRPWRLTVSDKGYAKEYDGWYPIDYPNLPARLPLDEVVKYAPFDRAVRHHCRFPSTANPFSKWFWARDGWVWMCPDCDMQWRFEVFILFVAEWKRI